MGKQNNNHGQCTAFPWMPVSKVQVQPLVHWRKLCCYGTSLFGSATISKSVHREAQSYVRVHAHALKHTHTRICSFIIKLKTRKHLLPKEKFKKLQYKLQIAYSLLNISHSVVAPFASKMPWDCNYHLHVCPELPYKLLRKCNYDTASEYTYVLG